MLTDFNNEVGVRGGSLMTNHNQYKYNRSGLGTTSKKTGILQIQMRKLKGKAIDTKEKQMQEKLKILRERRSQLDRAIYGEDLREFKIKVNSSLQCEIKAPYYKQRVPSNSLCLNIIKEPDTSPNTLTYRGDTTRNNKVSQSQLNKKIYMFSPRDDTDHRYSDRAAEVAIVEPKPSSGQRQSVDSQIKIVNLQISSGTQTNYDSARDTNRTN